MQFGGAGTPLLHANLTQTKPSSPSKPETVSRNLLHSIPICPSRAWGCWADCPPASGSLPAVCLHSKLVSLHQAVAASHPRALEPLPHAAACHAEAPFADLVLRLSQPLGLVSAPVHVFICVWISEEERGVVLVCLCSLEVASVGHAPRVRPSVWDLALVNWVLMGWVRERRRRKSVPWLCLKIWAPNSLCSGSVQLP